MARKNRLDEQTAIGLGESLEGMSLLLLQRCLDSLLLQPLALSPQKKGFTPLPFDGIFWTGSCCNIGSILLLNLDTSQKSVKLFERPFLKRGFLF